jgi:CHASE3 domain sensor protein
MDDKFIADQVRQYEEAHITFDQLMEALLASVVAEPHLFERIDILKQYYHSRAKDLEANVHKRLRKILGLDPW